MLSVLLTPKSQHFLSVLSFSVSVVSVASEFVDLQVCTFMNSNVESNDGQRTHLRPFM